MIPSIVAQPLSEAMMYFLGIDFNINSLPVAADRHRHRHRLRLLRAEPHRRGVRRTRDFDEADRRAPTAPPAKTVHVHRHVAHRERHATGCFFPMKFEAQMAFLLVMLMVFHAHRRADLHPADGLAAASRASRSSTRTTSDRRDPRGRDRRRTARPPPGRDRSLARTWARERRMMDFSSTPDEEAFRAAVRAWLRANLPAGLGHAGLSRSPRTPAEKVALRTALAARRCTTAAGPGSPGRGSTAAAALTPLEQLLFNEEYVAAGAPDMIDIGVGPGLTGPTLIHHGTDGAEGALPRAASCAATRSGARASPSRTPAPIWPRCARAARCDGDASWSTARRSGPATRSYADWCILIVRTDPDAPQAPRPDLPAGRHEDARASPSGRWSR